MKGVLFCGGIETEIHSKNIAGVNCHRNLFRSHIGAVFLTYAAIREW